MIDEIFNEIKRTIENTLDFSESVIIKKEDVIIFKCKSKSGIYLSLGISNNPIPIFYGFKKEDNYDSR